MPSYVGGIINKTSDTLQKIMKNKFIIIKKQFYNQ